VSYPGSEHSEFCAWRFGINAQCDCGAAGCVAAAGSGSLPAAYEEAAATLLAESGCHVRKWRHAGGVAYTDDDDWGIEAPRPRGAVSFGVFAHEVAHQLLHRSGSRPRWLEEVEAWEYALAQFVRFELSGALQAREHAAKSLAYASRKAVRRGANRELINERMPAWVPREQEVAQHGQS
jgi:hypothetical protein